jgi:aminoglycoside 6-adenylyltransferase
MLSSLPAEPQVLSTLQAWASAQPAVRAMLLTSSRARPEPGVDALSDYDVILVVPDPARFVAGGAWRSAYGAPLVGWGDEGAQLGQATLFRSLIHTDFVKIDFSFWPVALLQAISASGVLTPELDAGYRVLLDKDALTAGWPAASYRAFRPTPPTAADYQALVEEFWWEATYAAKGLWRDDFLFARWVLDNDMKLSTLRRLLEWHVALRHGWALRPGVLGRGLKPRLPPALWQALAATYVGPAPADNWQALFATCDLFRQVALEVGTALGYAYPEALEVQMRAFLAAVQGLPPPVRF